MHNGAVVRPAGPSNKGGPAQGPSVGQHLSGKGSGQPPASPSAAIVASKTSDQSLGRAGSSNDGADGQYGLAYGMAQSAPQQGYTTPVVSKVCSNAPIKSALEGFVPSFAPPIFGDLAVKLACARHPHLEFRES